MALARRSCSGMYVERLLGMVVEAAGIRWEAGT
jgi:hypothetical protein